MINSPAGLIVGFPSASLSNWGLKNPDSSHQSYQADSTARGLYPAGIGPDTSAIWIQ